MKQFYSILYVIAFCIFLKKIMTYEYEYRRIDNLDSKHTWYVYAFLIIAIKLTYKALKKYHLVAILNDKNAR